MQDRSYIQIVMPGTSSAKRVFALDVPGIHVFLVVESEKTWMAGTSPAMTVFVLLRRDRLGVGRQARQQRLQGGQRRMVGDAVDAGGAEMALEGGDDFHGCAVVFSIGQDAVAVFGQRLLQTEHIVADGAELEGFAAHDRRRLHPMADA